MLELSIRNPAVASLFSLVFFLGAMPRMFPARAADLQPAASGRASVAAPAMMGSPGKLDPLPGAAVGGLGTPAFAGSADAAAPAQTAARAQLHSVGATAAGLAAGELLGARSGALIGSERSEQRETILLRPETLFDGAAKAGDQAGVDAAPRQAKPRRAAPSKATAEKGASRRDKKKGKLYLFDAHFHHHGDAVLLFPPKAVFKILKAAGVRGALGSSRPNDSARRLHDLAPETVALGIMPYRADRKWEKESKTWFKDAKRVDLVEKLLTPGHPYRAIGEFHVHDGRNAAAPVIRRYVQLAARHGLFLHVHTDTEGIRRLFAQDPQAKILWAHAGGYSVRPAPTPEQLKTILKAHPTLWVDTSGRDEDIAPGGKLAPEWRRLFLEHSDRFMVGTDPWTINHWLFYPSIVAGIRAWLAALPKRVAENLAFKTAESLFGPGTSTFRPRKLANR